MIVSKRLMLAALQALEADLSQRDDLEKHPAVIYAAECRNIRFGLSCYSDDVIITSSRIRLPGEK